MIERVGGTAPIEVETRVVAATHRDLFQLASEGKFREDLAYRLQVVDIQLPPLRERLEDIPLLTQALLEKIAQHNEQATPAIDKAAVDKLQGYTWPGNVRELENVLTQAMVQARGGSISADHIHYIHEQAQPGPQGPADAPGEPAVLRTLEEVEAEHIQRVLQHTGGHKGRTCEVLGISRPALDRKILKYRLTVG